MDNSGIELTKKENIVDFFDVDDKKYCVLKDDNGEMGFARISDLDEKHKLLTTVPDSDFIKVKEAYDKYVDFMNMDDELEGDEV